MNRVTLEHLEGGIVTSSRMLSGDKWMNTIVELGCAAGDHSWMATVAILAYMEQETDSCSSVEEIAEIAADIGVCIACLRVIASSMAREYVDDFVGRFDRMKTAAYWVDDDEEGSE